jgi:hypothetical protein
MTQPRKDNCDICGKAFDTAKFGVVATCCGSLHCPDCFHAIWQNGGISFWGFDRSEPSGPVTWRRCKKCAPGVPLNDKLAALMALMYVERDTQIEIDTEVFAPHVVLTIGKYPAHAKLFISPEVLPRLVGALTDALMKTQGPTVANS